MLSCIYGLRFSEDEKCVCNNNYKYWIRVVINNDSYVSLPWDRFNSHPSMQELSEWKDHIVKKFDTDSHCVTVVTDEGQTIL